MAELTIDQAFQIALQHQQAGRMPQAEEIYGKILARQPNHPAALHHLGLIARQAGRHDTAVELIRRAIALQPNNATAYHNLGNALNEIGQLDEAIAAYRQAIALNSNVPETLNNLANALRVKGQLDEAIATFRQVIALKPDHAGAHNNLGEILTGMGQLDDAIAFCRAAVALSPNVPEAYSNLGNALKVAGQLDGAISAYRRALALRPSYAKGHSNLVLALHYHPACDAEFIAEEHRAWNRQHAEPLQHLIRPHGSDRNPDRRLRMGYVSPDLRAHPVGRFLLPLLAHHDKRQFEIFAYAQLSGPDEMTHRLRSFVDGWRNIAGLSDAQAADLIRRDRIDILVDLAMHTADNRLRVFAHKPAPVQATYLAYCSSTGMETIDYRLSDPYLDPVAGEESIYSEETIRLPETYWCYQPFTVPLEITPLPALKSGTITFGCLNNFCKVNEPTLAVWAEILRSVANTQLLLHAHEGSHRQRVLALMDRQGVDPKRVHFAARLRPEKYFQSYQQIDIVLDTLPFGGGTTTCDALWMGVPVVSQVGRTAVGRAGLSILSNMGLPELAGRSQEQYVEIAVSLANDLPRLSELRSTLRRRMERSSLMDAPRFTGNVEAAYRQMWRAWCERTDQ